MTYAQAQNGSLANWTYIMNDTLMKQANWNATNTSYMLGTNSTYSYALNSSLWTLNYSNYLLKRDVTNNSFVSYVNMSANNITFQASSTNISSNSTCVKIYGATSVLEVC